MVAPLNIMVSITSQFFLFFREIELKRGGIKRKNFAFFLDISENTPIFAPTESATLPVEQRTRAGLLFLTL
jgi:hypothetical protein